MENFSAYVSLGEGAIRRGVEIFYLDFGEVQKAVTFDDCSFSVSLYPSIQYNLPVPNQ